MIRVVRNRGAEAGSATVLVLGLGTLVWFAGLAVLLLAQVADARARAATAADLGALAAASHVVSGDPCRSAGRVVHAQSAELGSCAVDGWTVRVTARVPLGGALRWFPPVQARARAGPSAMPVG